MVVLATEWPEYQQADPQALVGHPANPLLVDCRTTLAPGLWHAAGWTVRQLGRPGKQNRAPRGWDTEYPIHAETWS
ncbi:hypothetical protein GCM10010430_28740 [Kitasatospora cystarginea]|uniref:UDP-glucose/GDP-mannose dehydrogenase C-terminal domain-containing protein n=1 Tax=Kitasatospora cystarginea TaxID=58350 RepID=A0ABP5QV12_9ACTN